MKNIMTDGKLLSFVKSFTQLLEKNPSEEIIFTKGKALLENLISMDDWLPEEFTKPHPQYYQQYLLYADPFDRFSVVSFVWAPGQKTPVHNHTVWGMVGQLRGEEKGTHYHKQLDGSYQAGAIVISSPGHVDTVSPNSHDIHEVANNHTDQISISIHVYGANIGKVQRHVYDPVSGLEKGFVSGYANKLVPNLWATP